MQTVNHLPDKLSARSPASNLGTSGGRSTVLRARAHQGVAWGWSRLLCSLTPPDRRAEFFGLWSFATHLSAVVGPLTYGLITWLSGGNHRIAILSTALFFVAGLWLLKPIDIGRGQLAARQARPGAPDCQSVPG
jgi:MFS family permease